MFHDFKNDQISDTILVAPCNNEYVLAKSRVSNTINLRLQEINEGTMEILSLNKDEIVCLPYKLIKDKLVVNDLELL